MLMVFPSLKNFYVFNFKQRTCGLWGTSLALRKDDIILFLQKYVIHLLQDIGLSEPNIMSPSYHQVKNPCHERDFLSQNQKDITS